MLELPRPPSEWAFVGRKAEVELALAELDAGRAGLVISGPPGAGRTRLAREIARAAAERGFATFWPSSGQLSEPTALAAYEDSTTKRPGLLVVDDAHLLDAPAAHCIERLARRGGVFLVATLAAGSRGPAAIRALWKEGIVPFIDLRPLAEPDVAELIESALGARAERGTNRMLWRACEGNLVWLRELLREGLRRGVLERRAGMWRWSGPPVLGAALRELALERVVSLPEAARHTLERITLTGPLELALLGAALEDGSLERLEREGLIAIERDGLRRAVRAAKPLCAEAVRESIPETRALRLQRELGTALLRLGLRRSGDRLRAATLLLDGDPAAGAPYFAAAAEAAWSQGEASLAERLARAALHGPQAVEARHFLAEALADQSRFEEALAEWEAFDAMEIDERARARAARSRAAILAHARGRTNEAREVLERTEARVESEDVRRVLSAMRASLGVAVLPPDRVVAENEQVLREPDLAPYVELRALISLFNAANLLGSFQRVLDERPRALRAARRCQVTNPFGELWVHVNSFYALLFSAALDTAEQLAAEQREAHADDPFVATRAYWTYALGLVLLWRGRVEAASALLREAAALLLEYDNGARQLVLFDLVVARAIAGASEDAEQVLREGEASRPGPPTALPGHDRARALVRAARGERSAAREILVEAGRSLLASGRALPAILAFHDAIRLGAGVRTARALESAASHTDGPLLKALAGHGFALATRDADALDDAADRLAALGAFFHAAEAAGAACEQHAKAGRIAAALASRQSFERLAARCEGAAFAPLGAGDPLSRREREVAELAARGASDREIAAKLSLSIRTVNAHLRSVYEKLDVEGRGALPTLLVPSRDRTGGEDGVN